MVMSFEVKRQAYLKYTQYMILAAKAIEPVLPAEEMDDHNDMVLEMEEAKTKLETMTTDQELTDFLGEP